MKVAEKLENFSNIAMQKAEITRNGILEEVESDFKKAVEEAEKSEHKKADELIMNETFKAQQLKNKEIIAASAEAKRKLVSKRNALVDEIFVNVKAKLVQHTKSAEYKQYLIKEINKLKEEYGNAEISLMQRDMHLQADIEAATGLVVKAATVDFLGGFTAYIPDKRGIVDCTFLAKLELEQNNFNLLKIKI